MPVTTDGVADAVTETLVALFTSRSCSEGRGQIHSQYYLLRTVMEPGASGAVLITTDIYCVLTGCQH